MNSNTPEFLTREAWDFMLHDGILPPGAGCAKCGHDRDEHSKHAGCFHSRDNGEHFCGCMGYREPADA